MTINPVDLKIRNTLGRQQAQQKYEASKSAEPEHKSVIVQAIEGRPRKYYDIDLSDCLFLENRAVGKVKYRMVSRTEATRAVAGSSAYLKEVLGDNKPDQETVDEARSCWILHTAIRDFNNPDTFGAFPSPRWMMDNLSIEQLAVILHHYQAVSASEGIIKDDITDADITNVVDSIGVSPSLEIPETLLANLPRHALAKFAVRVCMMLNLERSVNDLLRANLAEKDSSENQGDHNGTGQGSEGPANSEDVRPATNQ